MEHGIKITSLDGAKELCLTVSQGILLQSFAAPTPAPKTYTAEIDGRSGTLDYTDYFGAVKYQNRPVTATVNIAKRFNQLQQLEYHSKILTEWHGERVKLYYWGQPDRYYLGRLSIGDLTKESGVFSLSLDAEPYAYIITARKYTVTATEAEQVLTVENRGKAIMPTITVETDTAVTIIINGQTYSLSAGTFNYIDIQLAKAAKTDIRYSGAGTITFDYRELVL